MKVDKSNSRGGKRQDAGCKKYNPATFHFQSFTPLCNFNFE